MKEIQDIIRAFDRATAEGKQTALATVVHVQGSSYRRPGARMLVTEDGQLTGAISGGCLEGDALRKAQLVMSRKQPMLVTYDTTDEDDAKLGVGLGCEGIIHIVIEPVEVTNPRNPMLLLKTITSQRKHALLVTLFSLHDRKAVQPGTCLVQLEDGTVMGHIYDPGLSVGVEADASMALAQQASVIKDYISGENQFTAFLEFIKPVVSIVIIGAGNDVKPVVQIAHTMGWYITVVDGRPNYATKERFPEADRMIICPPGEILQCVRPDRQTVFVLMTHNYTNDILSFRELMRLPVPLSYLGILGPRKKLERILNEMQIDGDLPEQSHLSTVYGPVGLDLGAETPEEIALSIIAEIKAVLSKKSGKSLRENLDTIHPR